MMNNDVKGGLGNSYTAQFWEYDSRIGRKWNLDPKPIKGISLYATFNNSPTGLIDRFGDTAIINDKGVLTRNDRNGDGLLFHSYSTKDKNGKSVTGLTRIYLNDPKLDAEQIDLFDIGKKMVRFLDEDEVNWILSRVGADQPLPGGVNRLRAAVEAHTGWDFGPNVLVPNIAGKDGAEGLHQADDYPEAWNQGGGFIFFKGNVVNRVFNIPDAGNFLFSAAATRSGITYQELLVFFQANSVFTLQGVDPKADQSAIAQGYMYANHLKILHIMTYPIIGWFLNYDKKRPSWFDPNREGATIYRRSKIKSY